jgi:predicted Zn-dependent peptidase
MNRTSCSAFCILLCTSAFALPLYRDSLPNGLVVLTYEDSRLPWMNVALVCRSGAAYDPTGKAGLAGLTASTMTRGTSTISGDSVSSIIEFLGARLEPDVNYDRAGITMQMLSRDLNQGLDLLAELVQHPGFTAKEFIRERDRALVDARQELESPMGQVGLEFNRLLFPGHPYGSPVNGDTVTLPQLSREDLVAFHQALFKPNNCFVVGVGDITRQQFLAMVSQRFGNWAPGPVPELRIPELANLGKLKVKLIPRPDMNQSYVELGHLGIAMGDSDMMATRLMAYALGGSPISSRLGLSVREEGGLAYDVRCYYDRNRLVGAYRATVQTAKPRVAIEKITREIQTMHDKGAMPEELEEGVSYLTGSFPLTYSSSSGKLARVIEQETYQFGMNWLERYPFQVRAVKLEQVNDAARRHLNPGKYLLVVMGNVTREDLGLTDVEWIE